MINGKFFTFIHQFASGKTVIEGYTIDKFNEGPRQVRRSLKRICKRIFDITASAFLILVFSPAFLLIMLAISADSSGKVIFKQKRAGLYGKPFIFYKFRTMLPGAPRDVATADLFQAHRYITPVGRFLRQTSLDELPQLFNVLKGDMSFVGPRPVVLTERHLLELRRRWGADRVRPGITGLAQIRGRDQVPYRRKALYDRYYARHLSPWLDGKILWVTVRYVLKREGIREGALHPAGGRSPR